MDLILPDVRATQELGKKLGQLLPAGSTILLSGDLGTGKTTLVQAIGEGLGITEPILSPTFTLVNEYFEGRLPLYHLDLYRLQPGDIAPLYLENYWEGREVPVGITAIEWAERLPYRPLNSLKIVLSHLVGQGRQVKLARIGEFNFDLSLLI